MRAAALGLFVAMTTMSGCVAAIVPVVAGGAVGSRLLIGKSKRPAVNPRSAAASGVVPAVAVDRQLSLLPPGSALPPPTATPIPKSDAVPVTASIPPMWTAVVRHVAAQVVSRSPDSVVLVAGSTIANPVWVPCGSKPFVAIVDVELVGAAAVQESLQALRTMGVFIIAMGGRPIPGAQRTAIAARYCVIAIVGDQPGDFNDQFRDADPDQFRTTKPMQARYDMGWFLEDRSTAASAAGMAGVTKTTNSATPKNPLEGNPD